MSGYEWSLTVTLEVVKAFGPVFIGGAVAFVALRQWQTAKDKLAVDLFDRRYDAWEAVRVGSRAWSDDINAMTAEECFGEEPMKDAGRWKFVMARNKASFLFGKDVSDAMEMIEQAYSNKSSVRISLMTGDEDAREIWGATAFAPITAWGDFQRAVGPYMMLDKIAVNRPAGSLMDKMPWTLSKSRRDG